jgi:hypothetical protein
MHANTSMIRAYSQDSLVWGEEIPQYAVRFIVSSSPNDSDTISIWVNDENRPRYIVNLNVDVIVNQGDKIKVTYTLRTSGYKFFSNIPEIEKGIVIDKDYYIWVGFGKLEGEIA